MPISTSTAALIEKNKRFSNNPFLILLEINHHDLPSPIYLCNNNVNLVFNAITWTACVFVLDDINETKEAEVPTLNLTVIDLTKTLIAELDNFGGGTGATVIIRIINTGIPGEYLRQAEYNINSASVSSGYKITFTLGANKINMYRSPLNRYLKLHCRYKRFGGSQCGYDGEETECNRTLKRCKELENQARFGGFPGIGKQGVFA
jgi:phage-related protein